MFGHGLPAGWTTPRLGDICREITVGYVGPMADKYEPAGIPFLRSQNIHPFRLDLDDIKFIPPAFHLKLKKSALSPGDVAIVRTGYPGTACVIPATLTEANCADLVIVRPSQRLDPWFLAAIFNSSWGRGSVSGSLVGVAQQHFNVGAAKAMQIALPPIGEQRRIASILSAYDDLIENNTRRIAILEEMARRIYEEWFVRFRFPGHQNVRMVESELGLVPEGWKVVPLSELCVSVDDGDWIETKDQGGADYRLLQISNVGLNCFVETGNYRYVSAATFRQLRCREVVPGQILVARMPKPIGRAWLVTSQQWKMITAVDVAIIDPDTVVTSSEYLTHFLNSDATLASFAAQASGTTRLRITRKQIAAMTLCAPPASLAHKFREVISPMNDKIAVLVRKNTNLRTTRDLLLPKLISGELDVSALPEPEVCTA